MPQFVSRFWVGCAIGAIATLNPDLATAQIIPDSTLPVHSQVAPGCTVCTIDGGTVRGVNLFHSFREFSIPPGGSAWFNNAPQIQNILTRITGNTPSNIDGLIRANGTANLFLLNPNGIVFGRNAQLQIGGSFFASTAHSFKFADGSEFSATHPQAPPILTVNVPLGLQSGRITSGTITNRGNLNAGQDLILEATQLDLQGQLVAGRDLTLNAQDTVQIRDTGAAPFLAQSGRDLTIRGDRAIDILALSHPGHVPLQSGGNLSLVSDGIISGDARFATGGSFQVKSVSGGAAQFRSLYDPIISAAGNVEIFGDYDGAALLVESLGSVRFNGSVNITSNDALFSPLDPDPDLARLGSSNAFIVRAGRSALLYAPTGLPTTVNGATFQPGAAGSGITITGDISTNGGPVILDTTTGNIRVNSIVPFRFPGDAGSVTLSTGNGNIDVAGSILAFGLSNGGLVNLSTGNGNVAVAGGILTFSIVGGNGGDVRIASQSGDISLPDELNTFSLGSGNGGKVAISTANGNINTFKINTFSLAGGNAGEVEIRAGDRGGSAAIGNLDIGSINAFAVNGSGGKITLATNDGDVRSSELIADSYGGGNGGNVTLATINGDIAIEQDIHIASIDGTGGSINISTVSGNIATNNLISNSILGNGGQTSISAVKGDIRTGNINVDSVLRNGGSITIAANAGQVFTGSLNAQSIVQGNAGTIQTRSLGDMRLGDVNAWANQGNGGSVTVQTDSNFTSRSLLSYSREGKGSNISLQAGGDISTYSINTTADQGSGNITINTPGNLRLTFEDQTNLLAGAFRSTIYSSDTFGVGTGGDIRISAGLVSLESGAQISASTQSSGAGGNISITATELVKLSGTAPSNIFPGAIPAGAAGAPNELFLIGYVPSGNGLDGMLENTIYPTGIFTQTINRSTGNAGAIALQTPQLIVEGGATIGSTAFGMGTGGNIAINTLDGSVVLNAGGRINSGVVGADGSSGTISIQTGTLDITQAGVIQSQTIGRGNAGMIQIDASRSVNLAGDGSTIRSGSGDSRISDNQFGVGGDIRVTTPQLTVSNRAVLSAETYTASRGGSIFVNVAQFDANTGGQLRTTAFRSGQAGNIFVNATNQLTLANPETGLFANTVASSTGSGGSIFVKARSVLIQQDAGIAVDSLGAGQGGNIFLTANQVTLSDRGFLTAETASAQGGNINLNVRDILFLRRNSLISATAGTAQGSGDGGNIDIKALFIVGILGENSDIRANAFTGNGGKVKISAQGIFGLKFQPKLTPFSDITASSQLGINGAVILNLPNIDPNRGLVELPVSLVDPASRIALGCSAGGQARKESRFVTLGRGGLPSSPEDSFGGSQVLVNLVEPTAVSGKQVATSEPMINAAPRHSTPNTLVEAQGVAIAPNGVISLIAQAQTVVPHSNWQPPVECLDDAP